MKIYQKLQKLQISKQQIKIKVKLSKSRLLIWKKFANSKGSRPKKIIEITFMLIFNQETHEKEVQTKPLIKLFIPSKLRIDSPNKFKKVKTKISMINTFKSKKKDSKESKMRREGQVKGKRKKKDTQTDNDLSVFLTKFGKTLRIRKSSKQEKSLQFWNRSQSSNIPKSDKNLPTSEMLEK